MVTKRLQDAINRVVELPEAEQVRIAEELEHLLDMPATEEVPHLAGDVASVVQESIGKNATLLDYLKDK